MFDSLSFLLISSLSSISIPLNYNYFYLFASVHYILLLLKIIHFKIINYKIYSLSIFIINSFYIFLVFDMPYNYYSEIQNNIILIHIFLAILRMFQVPKRKVIFQIIQSCNF
jgi:hypothetical protein